MINIWVYSFPRTVVNKLAQTWWVKIWEMHSLIEVQSQGVGRTTCSPKTLGENPSLSLTASVGYGHFLASLHHFSICLSGHITFSSCLYLTFCVIWTLIIGFRAHLYNLGWSHLEILNLITSVRTLFLNKVTLSSWCFKIYGFWNQTL